MTKINRNERKALEEKINKLFDGDVTVEKRRPYKGRKVIEITGENGQQIELTKVAPGRWGELNFQRPSRGISGTITESFLKETFSLSGLLNDSFVF